MAVNLARAGHRVIGYNRTPAKSANLVSAGGLAADSIRSAVEGAEVICLMLPDSPDVEDVIRKPGGVLETAPPSALVIDFSTIRPDVAVSLAGEAASHGFGWLDAPVSGGEVGAIDGILSVMAGGTEENFARAVPILGAVGKTIVHVGPSGAGQTVKAANQLIVAANIEALAEAVMLLRAQGVDLEPAFAVLGGGLAGSRALDLKSAKMIDREFAPGFRLRLHDKDMRIVLDAARTSGVELPLGQLAAQQVAAAVQQGYGDLDHSALLLVVERLSSDSGSR
jgi:2-hydroxy-3-oxopropionate reductase